MCNNIIGLSIALILLVVFAAIRFQIQPRHRYVVVWLCHCRILPWHSIVSRPKWQGPNSRNTRRTGYAAPRLHEVVLGNQKEGLLPEWRSLLLPERHWRRLSRYQQEVLPSTARRKAHWPDSKECRPQVCGLFATDSEVASGRTNDCRHGA